MDDVFWGLLCGMALLGVFAVAVFAIVFTAVMHAWWGCAAESVILALLVLLLLSGRDREPRERREVQKGARWP
jgi:hypothetical protein